MQVQCNYVFLTRGWDCLNIITLIHLCTGWSQQTDQMEKTLVEFTRAIKGISEVLSKERYMYSQEVVYSHCELEFVTHTRQ